MVTTEQEYFDYFYEKSGYRYHPDVSLMVVDRRPSGIRACVVLYNYIKEERRIDWGIHTEGNYWGSYELAACLIDLVFVKLNVHRLQGFSSAPKSDRLVEHLGFKLDANLRDWSGPGDNTKLYSILSTELETTKFWEMSKLYYTKLNNKRGAPLNGVIH